MTDPIGLNTSGTGPKKRRAIFDLNASIANKQGTGGPIPPVEPVAPVDSGRKPNPQDPVFSPRVDLSKLKDLKIDPGSTVEIPISRNKELIKIKVSYVMHDADYFKLTLSLDKKLDGVEIAIKKKLWGNQISKTVLDAEPKDFICPISGGEAIYINGERRISLCFIPTLEGGVISTGNFTIQECLDEKI